LVAHSVLLPLDATNLSTQRLRVLSSAAGSVTPCSPTGSRPFRPRNPASRSPRRPRTAARLFKNVRVSLVDGGGRVKTKGTTRRDSERSDVPKMPPDRQPRPGEP